MAWAGEDLVEMVDGRGCGDCTVCCVVTQIDTKEFQKPPGIRCQNLCAGGGCSIYETRYPICRTYHCGWRYLEFLGDNWRPDRSGVLLAFTPEDELPAGYTTGVSFILAGRPPSGLNRALYHYVAHLIAGDVHVMVAVPGPPGFLPSVMVLNNRLREAARSGNHGPIEAAFAEALAMIGAPAERFRPAVSQHAPG